VDTAPLAVVAPGGEADIVVHAGAGTDAPTGENYGFITLTKGAATRQVPYFFLVEQPALDIRNAHPLHREQRGDTRNGSDAVETYRYPTAPFGNQPDAPLMVEDGAETLYATTL